MDYPQELQTIIDEFNTKYNDACSRHKKAANFKWMYTDKAKALFLDGYAEIKTPGADLLAHAEAAGKALSAALDTVDPATELLTVVKNIRPADVSVITENKEVFGVSLTSTTILSTVVGDRVIRISSTKA